MTKANDALTQHRAFVANHQEKRAAEYDRAEAAEMIGFFREQAIWQAEQAALKADDKKEQNG